MIDTAYLCNQMGFIWVHVGHDLEMSLKVKGRVVSIIWRVPKGKRVHAFQVHVVTLKDTTVSKQHGSWYQ